MFDNYSNVPLLANPTADSHRFPLYQQTENKFYRQCKSSNKSNNPTLLLTLALLYKSKD